MPCFLLPPGHVGQKNALAMLFMGPDELVGSRTPYNWCLEIKLTIDLTIIRQCSYTNVISQVPGFAFYVLIDSLGP